MYKLNLPPLDEILTDEGKEKLLIGGEEVLYNQYHPAGLVKPEWLTWRGLEWDFVNFFYKNNFQGIIHIDGPTVWGINWIYNGHGTMEYWLPEDVKQRPAAFDGVGNRSKCVTEKPPIKIYTTTPGAYLTNAAIPHRPTGYNGRYAFSLRCYANPITWKEAITKFEDLFI